MYAEANGKQNQKATRTQRRPITPNLRILVNINKHKCKMDTGQPKGTLTTDFLGFKTGLNYEQNVNPVL